MFHRASVLLTALLTVLAFAAGATPVSANTTQTSQHIAVPSYFYPNANPNSDWSRTDRGTPTVSLAIINPNSGPNTTPAVISDYVQQVQRSHNTGLTVLGYVPTGYATRSSDDVKADIDAYYNLYVDSGGTSVVDGIFFDEVTSDCTNSNDAAYYQDLANYVKGQDSNAMIVLNPGAQPEGDCYVKILPDIIIINFEGTYMDYLNSYKAPAWVKHYTASHFWHIIFDTAKTNVKNAVKLSKERNAGYVYVTSRTLQDNPYAALPNYFEKEIPLVN